MAQATNYISAKFYNRYTHTHARTNVRTNLQPASVCLCLCDRRWIAVMRLAVGVAALADTDSDFIQLFPYLSGINNVHDSIPGKKEYQ